jgi:hypothetical protein
MWLVGLTPMILFRLFAIRKAAQLKLKSAAIASCGDYESASSAAISPSSL